MRKNLIPILSITFSALVVLFCVIKMNMPICPYNNFKRIGTIEAKDYDSMLKNIKFAAGTSQHFSVEKLKELGLADGMRYNDGRYYSITPLSDGSYLLVLFHVWKEIEPEYEELYITVDNFCFVSQLCEREVFDEKIKIGMPMEEVLALDPDADSWERTVDKVTDYYSKHRFADRSRVEVNYILDKETQKPVVAEFYELDEKYNVITYLLPKDLELLTKE